MGEADEDAPRPDAKAIVGEVRIDVHALRSEGAALVRWFAPEATALEGLGQRGRQRLHAEKAQEMGAGQIARLRHVEDRHVGRPADRHGFGEGRARLAQRLGQRCGLVREPGNLLLCDQGEQPRCAVRRIELPHLAQRRRVRTRAIASERCAVLLELGLAGPAPVAQVEHRAQGGDTRDAPDIDSDGLEMAPVQCEQRGEMPPRRVSPQIDALGVEAVALRVGQ